jgi:predicted secreted protein
MTTVTLELPESLAKRLEPITRWLPALLEIALVFPKTSAAKTFREVFNFLASNPSPKEVYQFRAPDYAQERVSYLLELNRESKISEDELAELDEHLALEMIMTTLKTSLTNEEIA